VIIVNPTAGGGGAARLLPWLRERLISRPDVRLHVTTRRGEAEEVAAAASAEGSDRVVAVGGDGTVQEVVNGLCGGEGPPQLGIVPVGRGNDLARGLGLPGDPGEAWGVAIGRATRRIDIGRATNGDGRERWFASAGGTGFDAQVVAVMSTRRGWAASRAGYLATAVAELRRLRNRPVNVRLDERPPIAGPTFMVAFANGAFYGGGMRIAPDAAVDDGLLDVCLVGDMSRLVALGQVPHLYRGTHVRHPLVSMFRVARIDVDGDPAVRIHLDGEPFGRLPLSVVVEPGRLEVAVPTGSR
jgi:diacylglycerol kinase (ATP)